MKYDAIVIGAGIVGLATALKIKEKSKSLRVLVLDKEQEVAAHQTGHNSGVIHSGLYYKPGSLKALNCIKGYNMLLDFCKENQVRYELCGKVVVSTSSSETAYLNQLLSRGKENGLDGLKLLSAEELKEREPYVNGVEAIFVPQTGIIDYKQVSEKYASLFQSLGGGIHLGEKVIDIKKEKGQSTVVTTKTTYETTLVVNCSGLYSDKVARFTEQKLDVKIIPFRGEYFELKREKQHLVKHLIYPVPDPNFPFLGVHFTRMINGGVEAGPNAVFAFRREGYKKNNIHLGELAESLAWPGFQKVAGKYWKTGFGELYRSFSKAAFTKALQKLIPSIEAKDLVTGGAGVRAQACDRTGGLVDDFMILENEQAINVCNAPSPAATSSLSIGDTVSDLVLKRF
ncbi:MAG: L-2-hydroxyglutarate oxidase [Bacteroidota bacterium]